jgi:hypothetical protein
MSPAIIIDTKGIHKKTGLLIFLLRIIIIERCFLAGAAFCSPLQKLDWAVLRVHL